MSEIKIRDPRDILLAPVVSEKSYGLLDENKYTFLVAPGANKTEIKIAVEAVFDVKVTNVNTINRHGKKRRTRAGWGKRPGTIQVIIGQPMYAEGEGPRAIAELNERAFHWVRQQQTELRGEEPQLSRLGETA